LTVSVKQAEETIKAFDELLDQLFQAVIRFRDESNKIAIAKKLEPVLRTTGKLLAPDGDYPLEPRDFRVVLQEFCAHLPLDELATLLSDLGANITEKYDQPIIEHLRGQIDAARLPPHLVREGIAEPTDSCREKAFEIAKQLFEERQLIPIRISASAQEGIYLAYASTDNDRFLGIEVDNELDAVAVVSTAESVIQSGEFDGTERGQLLDVFLGQ